MHARACVAFVLLLMASAAVVASAPRLRVVDEVDLSRYAGKWYEVARLPNRFQEQCVGDASARYTLRPDGRIDIVNQCRTADGRIHETRGLARRAGNGKNNATLQVRFAPGIFSFLPMVWADYWIIGLGPDYTWAVVGAPSRDYLWILSRSPQLGRAAYEQAIEIAKGNGFDAMRIIRTEIRVQGSQVQGFKGSGVHGFTGSGVHRVTGSRVQEFTGSRVHGFTERASTSTPTGHVTPVPPSPQYPSGFFDRYCWW